MNTLFRREKDYFFSGLSFYTRIPCPPSVAFSPESLNKSRKYLGLIGLLVGLFAATVYVASALVLPVSVSVLLSMIATVYLTGAFHEDGFADSCDGFGGGWEKAQILSIMKDSRVGSYGVVGLILLLGMKFIVLQSLAERSMVLLVFALLCAHSVSRLLASWIMQKYQYVSSLETSKSAEVASVRLSKREMLYSIAPAATVIVIAWQLNFVLAVFVAWGVAYAMGAYFYRKIAGYTGDCLGAVQQVCEVVFYLVVLAESIK
ncbi:adenosylcobinamide-GDP ribazoletransferase [Leucothrix pacifica]|uniref:Adenosylcobinamide-GDP ribazoletransferase n=1 Tax=Leucothrix pacifica TaxID=1247513 RepID=A0A317CDP7_9GAMM|nr:adenosylcobinamide-GDP ribazoletransferase [Leucothrix pacifica]PWQ96648.1 adenosylcobinamide-GDP ribazoletransferase [Leucothrix pacifica]